jgi:hypothetical protein
MGLFCAGLGMGNWKGWCCLRLSAVYVFCIF